MAAFLKLAQPPQRVGFLDAVLERQDACEIHEGHKAAPLDVETVFVLAAFLDHEVAEEGERRARVQAVRRQMAQEDLLARGVAGDVAAQLLGEFLVAESGPEVEEDRGVEHFLGFRNHDPAFEMVAPDSVRLPPLRVRSHDPALAGRIAAEHQMVDGAFAKGREIDVCGAPQDVVAEILVDQGIVLVRGDGLLPSAFAAHEQPAEGRGRRSHFLEQQLQQLFQDQVVDDGDHPGDVPGAGAFLHKGAQHLGTLALSGCRPSGCSWAWMSRNSAMGDLPCRTMMSWDVTTPATTPAASRRDGESAGSSS